MNIDKVMALMPTIGHETQAKIRTALEQLGMSAREGAFCEAADAIGGLYSTKPQGLAERVEALAERVEALERANGGYVLAKPEDVDARVAQAARAGLAEMMSALRVLVREEIAASAKNTGEGEVEHAASVSRSVSAKDASRATTPNNAEEGASAMRHGSGARPDATSLSTACPLCHGMMTHPASKTLNECREVFRRVTKRGPCLSSPDLHGIAAVRDFLTLSPEKFRENWGPRDEPADAGKEKP